jgi:hypothetical protein
VLLPFLSRWPAQLVKWAITCPIVYRNVGMELLLLRSNATILIRKMETAVLLHASYKITSTAIQSPTDLQCAI